MPKMHNYYEELMNTHFNHHLEMCTELGISPKAIYTESLDDEDFD